MNKTTYTISGLVVILAIAGILFVTTNKTENNGEQNTEQEKTGSSEMTNEMTTEKNSLKTLLSSSSPQKCTFTDKTEAAESSGTVYIANGEMRGDFLSKTTFGPASGTTIESHLIITDNANHVWSNTSNQGIKIALADVENKKIEQDQSIDLDKQVDYSCESWKVNKDLFNLPSNIIFTDVGAMMEAMKMNSQFNAGGQIKTQ